MGNYAHCIFDKRCEDFVISRMLEEGKLPLSVTFSARCLERWGRKKMNPDMYLDTCILLIHSSNDSLKRHMM